MFGTTTGYRVEPSGPWPTEDDQSLFTNPPERAQRTVIRGMEKSEAKRVQACRKVWLLSCRQGSGGARGGVEDCSEVERRVCELA